MNRGPSSEHLGEGDWELFLFAPWMDEELKKEKKAKVQQRGLEEAKGGENPRKIQPTRKREERGKNEENK